jgi:hypothetical protein
VSQKLTPEHKIAVYVAQDGVICDNDVVASSNNWTTNVVLFVPLRLGLDVLNQSLAAEVLSFSTFLFVFFFYLFFFFAETFSIILMNSSMFFFHLCGRMTFQIQNSLTCSFSRSVVQPKPKAAHTLQWPQSAGILGGKPRSSYYFVGTHGETHSFQLIFFSFCPISPISVVVLRASFLCKIAFFFCLFGMCDDFTSFVSLTGDYLLYIDPHYSQPVVNMADQFSIDVSKITSSLQTLKLF